MNLSNPENIDLHPIADTTDMIDQVPIIDIGGLVGDGNSTTACEADEKIAAASTSWGFFQVVNHGVEPGQIENLWKQTRWFFDLSRDTKMRLIRGEDNPWGFYNNELTKNQRDKKEVFDYTAKGTDPLYGGENQWPDNSREFRTTMLDWQETCTRLSLTILESFCRGLGLPAKYLHPHFETNNTGFVRLNYYPVDDPMTGVGCAHQDIADLGVHHHTDAGALTVLLQDRVGGLQVHRDGLWHNIPSVDGALVINTGDMMQVWSNDIYQAAMHRVLAMEVTDRFSIPFFFNPEPECVVRPLPTVAKTAGSALYNDIHWGYFRGQRSKGDYADCGTEIQIAHYRKQ